MSYLFVTVIKYHRNKSSVEVFILDHGFKANGYLDTRLNLLRNDPNDIIQLDLTSQNSART